MVLIMSLSNLERRANRGLEEHTGQVVKDYNILFRVIRMKCDIKYEQVTDGLSQIIWKVIQYLYS